MPDKDQNDGFLMRWSRRKRGLEPSGKSSKAVADGGDAHPPVADAPDEPVTVAALDDGRQQPELTSDTPATGAGGGTETADGDSEAVPPDLENVDIDALDYDSDYKRFMQDGVPEALKRRALRQLWRSDPILANIDGLNDYDDDFTDAALAVDVLKTVHKVGRGYLTDDDDDSDETDEIENLDAEEPAQVADGDEQHEAAGGDAEQLADGDGVDDAAAGDAAEDMTSQTAHQTGSGSKSEA